MPILTLGFGVSLLIAKIVGVALIAAAGVTQITSFVFVWYRMNRESRMRIKHHEERIQKAKTLPPEEAIIFLLEDLPSRTP